jgi:ribosomal protein S18 acetylase RimI-like enzyme
MQDMRIEFRYHATTDDAACVRQLVAGTGFFSAAEIDVAEELVSERLAKGESSGYEFVFALQGDRVVGYSCYGPIPCTVGSYDLYWIAVAVACQRQGLGGLLVRETERLVRESRGRQIYVETSGRPIYAPTRGFYAACGYQQAAVFADFYAPGDSKVVYRKILSEPDSTEGH